jgi:DNA polymerase I
MDTVNAEAFKNGTTPITFPESLSLMEKYKKTYRQVNGWLQAAGNHAFVTGQSTTMYGRKRYFNRPDPAKFTQEDYDKQVGGLKRQGSNTPIQGTSADITKLAMLNVYQSLEEGGYRAKMIIQVHDEIVVLAHKRQAEQVRLVVEEAMVESGSKVLKNVPVKVESYMNDYWKK